MGERLDCVVMFLAWALVFLAIAWMCVYFGTSTSNEVNITINQKFLGVRSYDWGSETIYIIGFTMPGDSTIRVAKISAQTYVNIEVNHTYKCNVIHNIYATEMKEWELYNWRET
jgi:hypothetical protein